MNSLRSLFYTKYLDILLEQSMTNEITELYFDLGNEEADPSDRAIHEIPS
jgi:hypothetical protein